MKMKKAFTLAEILLVVAIIGTVSVLTVNNAVKSSNTAEKITKLRKTYDILQTAIMAGMDRYGHVYSWGYASNETTDEALNRSTINKALMPFLKVEKDCSTGTGCWTSTFKPNLSSKTIDSNKMYYKAILANGASIAITFVQMQARTSYSAAGTSLYGDYPYDDQDCAWVYIDVDGPNKGGCKLGDDVFAFAIMGSHGLFPMGNNHSFSNTANNHCPKTGEYCTAWAFYKGNQDYFKCPDELSWTDKNKAHCPN